MKKYRSKYQRIIEIKDLLQKQAEEKLNRAILSMQKIAKELEEEEKKLYEAYFYLENLLQEEELNLFFIRNQNLLIASLKNVIAQKKIELKDAQIEVDRRKEEYFQAKKERKKFEILEERQREEFQKQQQKDEIKFLDEIGNIRNNGKI